MYFLYLILSLAVQGPVNFGHCSAKANGLISLHRKTQFLLSVLCVAPVRAVKPTTQRAEGSGRGKGLSDLPAVSVLHKAKEF